MLSGRLNKVKLEIARLAVCSALDCKNAHVPAAGSDEQIILLVAEGQRRDAGHHLLEALHDVETNQHTHTHTQEEPSTHKSSARDDPRKHAWMNKRSECCVGVG